MSAGLWTKAQALQWPPHSSPSPGGTVTSTTSTPPALKRVSASGWSSFTPPVTSHLPLSGWSPTPRSDHPASTSGLRNFLLLVPFSRTTVATSGVVSGLRKVASLDSGRLDRYSGFFASSSSVIG